VAKILRNRIREYLLINELPTRDMNFDQLLESAFTYYQAGNFQQAERICREMLTVQPDNADICNNLGLILSRTGQLDEAIMYYKKAIRLDPTLVDAYYNLGIIFQDKMQHSEAIAYYSKALRLDPVLIDAHYNMGIAFRDLMRINEAITCYQNAIQLDPNFATAHFNLSLALLLSGNFREGWEEFEWRWKIKELSQRRNFLQPQWNGANIPGKTLLLHAEDGFGDTIQFVRYAPLIAQHDTKVIVECQKELTSLIQNLDGVSQVVSYGDELPDFDFYCSLLRLPYVFRMTLENLPVRVSYIKPYPSLTEKWRERMKYDNSKFKIGLVWSGSAREGKLRYRSCPFEFFSVLADLDNITFYSLQKQLLENESINIPGNMKFVNYMKEIDNFSDTAALIENLDFVISVDTAVAHLAGALGKQVWTLVSFPPDWRWMLDRKDSPWYPTMKLFRQPSQGEWQVVIDNIYNELYKKLAS
jgi:Tfp pilus assembly protein PilF